MAATPLTNPNPDAIREARLKAGLTQTQAGAILGAPLRTWQDWEYGHRDMPPTLWHCWQYWSKGKKAPPLATG